MNDESFWSCSLQPDLSGKGATIAFEPFAGWPSPGGRSGWRRVLGQDRLDRRGSGVTALAENGQIGQMPAISNGKWRRPASTNKNHIEPVKWRYSNRVGRTHDHSVAISLCGCPARITVDDVHALCRTSAMPADWRGQAAAAGRWVNRLIHIRPRKAHEQRTRIGHLAAGNARIPG